MRRCDSRPQSRQSRGTVRPQSRGTVCPQSRGTVRPQSRQLSDGRGVASNYISSGQFLLTVRTCCCICVCAKTSATRSCIIIVPLRITTTTTPTTATIATATTTAATINTVEQNMTFDKLKNESDQTVLNNLMFDKFNNAKYCKLCFRFFHQIVVFVILIFPYGNIRLIKPIPLFLFIRP